MTDAFHYERERDFFCQDNVIIVDDDMANDKSKQCLPHDILSQFIK